MHISRYEPHISSVWDDNAALCVMFLTLCCADVTGIFALWMYSRSDRIRQLRFGRWGLLAWVAGRALNLAGLWYLVAVK